MRGRLLTCVAFSLLVLLVSCGGTPPANTLGPDPAITNAVYGAAGEFHFLALTAAGSVLAWGQNYDGELGDGTTFESFRRAPSQVVGLSDVAIIAAKGPHSLALRGDGTVWAWGYNAKGELGDGTTVDRSVPVEVIGLTDAIAIATGYYHSLAIKQDGTVWAWGSNEYGQLGIGTTIGKSSPVQVIGLTGAVAIAAGQRHSLALLSDGTVWAWGDNEQGELGDSTNARSRLSPVRVSNLDTVTAVASGSLHSIALRRDGTVWGWGDDDYGQVGDGTASRTLYGNVYAPVQVSGISDVVWISGGGLYSLAVKQDGSVWGWGDNRYGQIDGGGAETVLRPLRVEGLEGVSAAYASTGQWLALHGDGRLSIR